MNPVRLHMRRGIALGALLAVIADACGQPLSPEPREPANTCPTAASPEIPWVAVVSNRQPIRVRTTVTGEHDPTSGPELMAERGLRATGKWIGHGLGFGGAIGPPIGALPFFASLVTSPLAFLAGAIDGGSDAAVHSERHEALGRLLERELQALELEAQVARRLAGTLGGVASAPVLYVDGGRFTSSALHGDCGAVVVLELEIEHLEFEAPSLLEFVARPSLSVRYRLTQAPSRVAPIQGTAQFTGRYHKFASIELDGAGSLGSELIAETETLSGRILAALPSTVAWTRPPDTKLAATPVLAAKLVEDLRQPLRVHPDLVRPSSVRLAAIAASD